MKNRIYDEENQNPYEDDDREFDGFEMDDSVSVFRTYVQQMIEEETEATPIPVNELTVLLAEADAAGVADGKELTLSFVGEGCDVSAGKRKIGSLKPAFVRKLRTERAGQGAKAYFKRDTPPMVRIVFGEGDPVPPLEEA